VPSVGFAGTADRSGGATRCNAVQRLLLLGAQPRNACSSQFRSLGAEQRGNVVCDARDLGVGVRVTEGRHIISVVGGMALRAPNDDLGDVIRRWIVDCARTRERRKRSDRANAGPAVATRTSARVDGPAMRVRIGGQAAGRRGRRGVRRGLCALWIFSAGDGLAIS